MKKLAVDIWSDIACPWCYVGKRRFEAALARFAHRDGIELTWRAFELDPSAPAVHSAEPTYAQRLARKYGMSEAQAQGRIRHLVETAATDGLDFHVERIRGGNTFDAHRLIHLATSRSHRDGDAMKERLLRAYFCEGEAIGDRATLARLAGELGFDAGEVSAMLAGDAHADAVRADEREAAALGIHGVPFFVIGGRYAVSGAQPAELLLGALDKAWSELPEMIDVASPEGESCGPDGCA